MLRRGLLLNMWLPILMAMPSSVALATPPPQAADDPPAELSSDAIYAYAMKYLASGRQQDAESLLQQATESYPRELRFVFLSAVCLRSRFLIADADPLFMRVAAEDRDSVHGKASLLIVAMDQHVAVKENFRQLDALSRAHPRDPLLVWMTAVQCRAFRWNHLGVERYARLFTLVDPGPVLAHQTCANLLEDLQRYDEALVHRKIALELEDGAPWAYDGLGNTLTHLKRFDEADAAYKTATSLDPRDAQYWRNWAYSKRDRGDAKAAAELNARADELEKRK